MRMGWFVGVAGLALAGIGASLASADEDPLPRRAFFGARSGPMPGGAPGVQVAAVVPKSPAERAGLRAGDQIKAIDAEPVANPGAYLAAVTRSKPGATLKITAVRDNQDLDVEVALVELPVETSEIHTVQVGSIESKGGRLRTLVTVPKAPGPPKRPALLLIQGIGQFTVENFPVGFGPYQAVVDDFSKRGYVTYRVDKPGCGDSQGGPLRDVDFLTQLDGFRQALRDLKARPDVDPAKVLIFGHSMGGVWGPLIAAEEGGAVAGIAAYGTVAETWMEYVLKNVRRQAALGGADAAEIDRQLKNEALAGALLYHANLSPDQVIERHPELKAYIDENFTERNYYSGCSVEFFRQLAQQDLAAAWQKFDGHALAVWGRADFVSGEDDHRLIAQIVEKKGQGRGRFVALDNSDHGMDHAATPEESYAKARSGGGELNLAFLDVLRAWSDEVIGKAD